MIAQHPKTKSRIAEVEKYEQGIDVEKLVKSAVSEIPDANQ
jgi:hypothetical protein